MQQQCSSSALYVQLISTFSSTRGFSLSVPRGRSVISHLKSGTTYPSILGFALPYQPSNIISKRNYLNSIYTSLPSSSPHLATACASDSVCLLTLRACIIMTDRSHNRHGPKKTGGCCAAFAGGAGPPSNTMWPGPRSTSVPSDIFIHPALWPQQRWTEN